MTMTTDNPDPLEVRLIETVSGDFLTEPGEPFWRIEAGGFCADFDYKEAAENFANAIAQHYAPVIAREARLREALEMIAGHKRDPGHSFEDDYRDCQTIARQALGAKP